MAEVYVFHIKTCKQGLKRRLLLRFTHHKAKEEADFCHIGDGELSYSSQHGFVVFGRWVGHPGQFGLQGLSRGKLTHLHDVAKTHPMLFGSCSDRETDRALWIKRQKI